MSAPDEGLAVLAELRAQGWRVAVHNDYEQGGVLYTFWLFTQRSSGRFIKGEGRSDRDAIRAAADSIAHGGPS